MRGERRNGDGRNGVLRHLRRSSRHQQGIILTVQKMQTLLRALLLERQGRRGSLGPFPFVRCAFQCSNLALKSFGMNDGTRAVDMRFLGLTAVTSVKILRVPIVIVFGADMAGVVDCGRVGLTLGVGGGA